MKSPATLAPLALATILAVLSAGCDDPSSSSPIVKPRDEVWEATIDILQRRRFNIDEMDREEGTLVTKWRFKPSIHAFEGTRHRAEVTIKPALPEVDPKSGEKQWLVEIKVELERNEDIGNPMVYTEGSWRNMGRDTDEESIILESIHFAIHDPSEFGPSEEARRLWEKQEQYEKEIADLKAREERDAQRLRELEAQGSDLEARKGEDADPDGSGVKD